MPVSIGSVVLEKNCGKTDRHFDPKRKDLEIEFLPYHMLSWLKLEERRKLHIATLIFKILKTETPSYLSSQFKYLSSFHNLNTRSGNRLCIPPHRTNFFNQSFQVAGARLWNSVDSEIRELNSVESFRGAIGGNLSECVNECVFFLYCFNNEKDDCVFFCFIKTKKMLFYIQVSRKSGPRVQYSPQKFTRLYFVIHKDVYLSIYLSIIWRYYQPTASSFRAKCFRTTVMV